MTSNSVLVLGIYLVDQPNWRADLVREFSRPGEWRVTQRWQAMGRSSASTNAAQADDQLIFRLEPKFLDSGKRSPNLRA